MKKIAKKRKKKNCRKSETNVYKCSVDSNLYCEKYHLNKKKTYGSGFVNG